jgi:hypothetical protein
MNLCISKAVRVLRDGGVVCCPTEGVFGLSCMPDDALAIIRLLAIKQRDAAKGLILIAASKEQLQDWIAIPPERIPDPDPTRPITWIVPAAANVSILVRGEHTGIPAIQATAQLLAGEGEPGLTAELAAKYPTGALAVIDFGQASWSRLDPHSGFLAAYLKPRDLDAPDDGDDAED